ncbi:MAG TPA: hypothetical protein PLE30_07635 [Candidatus Kapabacteria bacterium]|nr:hypothetical protein [Candidatus Kapabacteria bacterium]
MKVLVLFLALVVCSACSSIKECNDASESGNIGKRFNTEFDEYAPFYYKGKLYFTSLNVNNPSTVRIFYSEYKNDSLLPPTYENNLPLYTYPNGGLPIFFERDGKEYLIFGAMNNSVKRINSDLYISEKVNGKWSEPSLLSALINTESYESYPAISQDGKNLYFVSDRDGGFGGLDIYWSQYENGQWSEAKNLGNTINTESDELAPNISEFNELYFSSDKVGGYGGFDVYKTQLRNNEISDIILLKESINSKFDDIGSAAFDNSIVISSNRAGGCGGKDLYKFTLCKPVFYKGTVISKSSDIPLDGKALLLDNSKNIISEQIVNSDGIFNFELHPNRRYYVRYFNSCLPNYIPEQQIDAICSDSSVIKLAANFIIPDNLVNFDFKDYKIPFFVTGYYHPNSVDDLQALRLKFSYNIFGKNDNTKYIENPGKIYDEYAIKVEQALNGVISYIVNILSNIHSECVDKHPNLKIKITGFADSRPISPTSIYDDESIDDLKLGFSINRKDKIDNLILSKLRAYFTYKYLDNKLKYISNYTEFINKIDWEILGQGVDNADIEQALQRRVNIEIGMENNTQ